jgi:hypothetical protein
MNKRDILESALEARHSEIFEYQINIDNYSRAIAKIDAEYQGQEDLLAFRENLEGLLASSKLEQTKAIIIRDVILDQLNESEAS